MCPPRRCRYRALRERDERGDSEQARAHGGEPAAAAAARRARRRRLRRGVRRTNDRGARLGQGDAGAGAGAGAAVARAAWASGPRKRERLVLGGRFPRRGRRGADAGRRRGVDSAALEDCEGACRRGDERCDRGGGGHPPARAIVRRRRATALSRTHRGEGRGLPWRYRGGTGAARDRVPVARRRALRGAGGSGADACRADNACGRGVGVARTRRLQGRGQVVDRFVEGEVFAGSLADASSGWSRRFRSTERRREDPSGPRATARLRMLARGSRASRRTCQSPLRAPPALERATSGSPA